MIKPLELGKTDFFKNGINDRLFFDWLRDLKIIILMPAYNVEKLITKTINRIPKDFMQIITKLIIVNDGSIDKTQEVIDNLIEKNSKIEVIKHINNQGYGATQKTGFNRALELNADIIILLHSDGQYAPELLLKLVHPFFEENVDVVLGSRILGKGALKGGMPLYKYLGNKFLTFIENLAYGMKVSEYHTGYMLYSKNALRKIPFNRLSNTFHFDGEMVMMSGKKNLKLKEVPISTTYADESSNLNSIKYGLNVFKIIIKEKLGKYD